MRLRNIIIFVAFCSFTAYYVYEPIPEEIEEKWKLMLTNCFFKTISHLVRKKNQNKQTKQNRQQLCRPVDFFTRYWYLRCILIE